MAMAWFEALKLKGKTVVVRAQVATAYTEEVTEYTEQKKEDGEHELETLVRELREKADRLERFVAEEDRHDQLRFSAAALECDAFPAMERLRAILARLNKTVLPAVEQAEVQR